MQMKANEENIAHGFLSQYSHLLSIEYFSKIPYGLGDMWSSLKLIYKQCPDVYLTVKFGFAYFYAMVMV